MTTKVGNNIVDRRLDAGVPKLSPCDLHTTSTTVLAGMLDVFQTMDWAGHESANTTQSYVAEARHLAQANARGRRPRLWVRDLDHAVA